MIRKLFFVSILLLPVSVTAADLSQVLPRARELNLAADPAWVKLIHFQRDILFRYRSTVDDPQFFISPRGHKDPEEELMADLKSFLSREVVTDDSAACRFPARYAWLNEKLNFDTTKSGPVCER